MDKELIGFSLKDKKKVDQKGYFFLHQKRQLKKCRKKL